MTAIVFMGIQGSGKGTQVKKLKEYNITHLSSGACFRKSNANSELDAIIKSYIDKGNLVPTEITIRTIIEEVDRIQKENPKTIIGYDGVPRNSEQIVPFEKELKKRNQEIVAVINYWIHENEEEEDKVARSRIIKRANEKKAAGQKVREDDLNEDAVERRLETFRKNTKPVIEHYRKLGIVHDICAERNLPVEENIKAVHLDTLKVLKKLNIIK